MRRGLKKYYITSQNIKGKCLKIEDKNLHTDYNENRSRNESIGYGLDNDKREDYIADQSNKPFWESNHFYNIKYDLKKPINIEIKCEIFDFFGLDADNTYEQNLSLAK